LRENGNLGMLLVYISSQEMPQKEKEAAMTIRIYEVFVTITLWGLSLPLT